MKANPPTLTCTLSELQLKERKKNIEDFKTLITRKEEIENGFLFQFEGTNEALYEIFNLIKLERTCCSFLSFKLKIEKLDVPISLAISGPQGTKDFLSHELGL